MNCFEFDWKITFNNTYLNYVMFYLRLHNTFAKYVPNLITVGFLFFIKSLFRMCSKCPPQESMHAWTSLIMDGRTISRVPGRSRLVWQTSKHFGEVAVHCQLELNTMGVSSVPRHKNRKCLMSDEREGCTSKIDAYGHILTRTVSLFWCRELTTEICPRSFGYAILCILVAGVRNLYNDKYQKYFFLFTFSSRCARYI
jgi:hypothetical protein